MLYGVTCYRVDGMCQFASVGTDIVVTVVPACGHGAVRQGQYGLYLLVCAGGVFYRFVDTDVPILTLRIVALYYDFASNFYHKVLDALPTKERGYLVYAKSLCNGAEVENHAGVAFKQTITRKGDFLPADNCKQGIHLGRVREGAFLEPESPGIDQWTSESDGRLLLRL